MKAQTNLATGDHPSDQLIPQVDIADDLNAYGAAVLPRLLTPRQCAEIGQLVTDPSLSRTPPILDQSAWGTGEHRYFQYPMPEAVTALRTAFYSRLAPIANAWNERMEIAERFPKTHIEFLQRCVLQGQLLPTSMLLDFSAGQYNLLHQDLYGEHAFPLQVIILLSQRGDDYSGGELVIAEQRPRMQTRPEVLTPNLGDAVVLAVSNRPVTGTKGTYRVNLRHGFSKIRTGRLLALSLVFHDAAA